MSTGYVFEDIIMSGVCVSHRILNPRVISGLRQVDLSASGSPSENDNTHMWPKP